jgi:hypothetical protein
MTIKNKANSNHVTIKVVIVNTMAMGHVTILVNNHAITTKTSVEAAVVVLNEQIIQCRDIIAVVIIITPIRICHTTTI